MKRWISPSPPTPFEDSHGAPAKLEGRDCSLRWTNSEFRMHDLGYWDKDETENSSLRALHDEHKLLEVNHATHLPAVPPMASNSQMNEPFHRDSHLSLFDHQIPANAIYLPGKMGWQCTDLSFQADCSRGFLPCPGLSPPEHHESDQPGGECSYLTIPRNVRYRGHSPAEVFSHSAKSLQDCFLDFLMENLALLEAVGPASGLITIEHAFKEDLKRRERSLDFIDAEKIFRNFRPAIGSIEGRRERDTVQTHETKVYCPFQFCDSYFTRRGGLRNHLSAHFNLKPRRCTLCKQSFSKSSFRRHTNTCSKKTLA